MPCATIHMLTAGRVLTHWEHRPQRAPFRAEDPSLRSAFLLGAMGPDMGFVPGVERLVSELAHYVSSADLTRRLLREAHSPRQAAFAWGWATHHVTDVEIHPLVGRACGEHLLGDRSLRLNSSEDLETHVAMEVGLDLVFHLHDPSIPPPPRRAGFGDRDLDFVARALEGTYGIPWTPESLWTSHRKAAARTARWPRALTLLGRSRGFQGVDGAGRPWDPALALVVEGAGRVVPSGSAPAGFLRPLRPPDWIVERVCQIAAAFPGRFQERVDDRLRGLENRNLETGRAEGAPVEHPDSSSTVRRLRELQRRHRAGG